MDQLVYGELGINALATLLGALGVRPGDTFVDIGAGDGVLVLAAPLLYPELRRSRGIECLPDLVERAQAASLTYLSAHASATPAPSRQQSSSQPLLLPPPAAHRGALIAFVFAGAGAPQRPA